MKRLINFIRRHPWKSLARLGMGVGVVVIILGIAVYIEVKDRIELVSPGATPFFEDYRGNYISEGWGSDSWKGYWEIGGEVPHRVKQCFIAVEDKRFYDHNGVDWRALGRAFINNISGGPRHGASTIAMQVARMQYALEGKRGRSYWRKMCEVAIAHLLVRKYGREEVLRHYLRLVPMGNRIHGASYASRRYFRKPLQDLGWAEAAILAALPKAPGQMNLFNSKGFRRAVKRAELVLNLLKRQKRITPDEFSVSLRHLKRLQPPVREKRPFHSFHAISVMEEALKKQKRSTFRRPVRSTLDLDLQFYLTQTAGHAMDIYRNRGAGNIAMMVIERNTGKVRGYLGSEFYYDDKYAGAIDYARVPRSAGSTLKPFIFALGLADKKFQPSTIVADLPYYVTHETGQYMVCNYDNTFLGPMLYRKALANSRNAPAVRVLKKVGLTRVHNFFRRIGLEKSGKPSSHYGLGLAVGGLYVNLHDLVSAYGILANDGKEFRLQWFETPLSSSPSCPSWLKKQDSTQLLPEDTARQLGLFLSDPLSRLPSFQRMGPLEYPFPVAVKTGTSQGFRDAWAVAWSSKYIVGVWMGHPNNDRMNNINGTTSARIAKTVMMHLHPGENRGIREEPFPKPRGFRPVKICTLSGGRAHESCSDVMLEYFRPGTEPVSACAVHRVYAVDRRTGKIADTFTPPKEVEQKTFTILPPQYTAWASTKGFEKPPVHREKFPHARIEVHNPIDKLQLVVDPETPIKFQTLSLKAKVTPSISHIVWIVDGKPLKPTPYPYIHRWRLEPGEHTFQARFPNANVSSEIVKVTVTDY